MPFRAGVLEFVAVLARRALPVPWTSSLPSTAMRTIEDFTLDIRASTLNAPTSTPHRLDPVLSSFPNEG